MTVPVHRVAVIDGTPLLRHGLRSMIEKHSGFTLVLEAPGPAAAIEGIRRSPPDLIICEADFGGGESIFDLLRLLQGEKLKVPVLTFSHLNERIWATRVLQAGAHGFLMKSAGETELLHAAMRVLDGKIFLSRTMTDHAVDHLAAPVTNHSHSAIEDLTNRELEVLGLIGEGLASKEIAEALHISIKTVESHRSRLRSKLGVDNSAGLICLASQWSAFDKEVRRT